MKRKRKKAFSQFASDLDQAVQMLVLVLAVRRAAEEWRQVEPMARA